MKIFYLGIILLFLQPLKCVAQFSINGNAFITTPECTDSVKTYQLTPDIGNQSGQIWDTNKINLRHRFNLQFQIFLGSNTYSSGADGIVFVFQNLSPTEQGVGSGYLGYGGIKPSVGIEFDSFENYFDPPFCHTAIEKDGDLIHTDGSGNNLAGPVQLSPTNPNLPDGNWHNIEIIWNPATDSLSVYYECVFRVAYKGDIIDSIFGGNPNVYWGFTGGTGSYSNNQKVCMSYFSNSDSIPDTAICKGDSVKLIASGGVSYKWSPAIGVSNDTAAVVYVKPDTTTTYTVYIENTCGIVFEDSTTVKIKSGGTPPLITGTINKCKGSVDTLTANGATNYIWDNGTTGNTYIIGPIESDTTVTLVGYSASTCPGESSFKIHVIPSPTVVLNDTNNCFNAPVTIHAIATDSVPVTYSWSPGGQTNSSITVPDTGQTYTVTVSNGCITTEKVKLNPVIATLAACCDKIIFLGDDTIMVAHGLSPGEITSYIWSPSVTCLDPLCDSVEVSPKVTTSYTVIGRDSLGCETEQIIIIVVETACSDFIVPNVFTPTEGGLLGLNNVFYIKAENMSAWDITIYDRWGVEMFKSSNPAEYWPGTTEGGGDAPAGVYYYIIHSTCQNTTYKKDGFIQLIR